MAREKRQLLLNVYHLTIFFLWAFHQTVDAQVLIPPKYDGFVYEGKKEAIQVEAFFDPVCPDSRDAWPPLKQALKHYSSNGRSISLIVHPFALPYHDNAFVSCRALHIANRLNASTTYPVLELFFKHQEKYYNKATYNMSRAAVLDHMVKLMLRAVGESSLPAIQSGFEDRQTDMATRISFKYGCSRGVMGTPYFFVNGFPLPDFGSALNYSKWRSIIDPLLGQNKERAEAKINFL